MNEMMLKLTPEEVQGIIQVLGQLPTSSGAYPLMQKIIAQSKPEEDLAQ